MGFWGPPYGFWGSLLRHRRLSELHKVRPPPPKYRGDPDVGLGDPPMGHSVHLNWGAWPFKRGPGVLGGLWGALLRHQWLSGLHKVRPPPQNTEGTPMWGWGAPL